MILKKFPELRKQDQVRVDDDFKQMIKLRSMSKSRAQNLTQQHSRFQHALKKQEEQEVTKDFVNHSNKLNSLALKSQHSVSRFSQIVENKAKIKMQSKSRSMIDEAKL